MPEPPKPDENKIKKWEIFTNTYADECAKRHGLSKKKVREIYHKLVEIEWYFPHFPSKSALDEAIEFIEPKKALKLFENTDLSLLKNRCAITHDAFVIGSMPISTHDELADITSEFIEHQYVNSEKILQTGFPQRIFLRSRWMDWELGRCYFMKLPIDYPFYPYDRGVSTKYRNLDLTSDSENNQDFYEIWIKDPPETQDILSENTRKLEYRKCYKLFYTPDYSYEDGIFYDKYNNAIAEVCEFSKAPYLDFLYSGIKPYEIMELRNKLFNVRLDILKLTEESLRKSDPSKYWQNSREIITKSIFKDDLDLLNRADSALGYHDLFEKEKTENEKLLSKTMLMLLHGTSVPLKHPYRLITQFENNSGFDDLIYFIGWIESELKTKVLDQAKKAISKLPVERNIQSYFELVDKPWIKKFDAVLDKFNDNFKKLTSEILNFHKKVHESYKGDFFVKPTSSAMVREKHLENYTEHISKPEQHYAQELEIYGHIRDHFEREDISIVQQGQLKITDLNYLCKGTPWSYDDNTDTYLFNNVNLKLAPLSKKLLHKMLMNINKYVATDELIQYLYSENKPDESSKYTDYIYSHIKDQIHILRESLPKNAKKWVKTFPRKGYGVCNPDKIKDYSSTKNRP